MTLRVKDTTFRDVAPLNVRSKTGSRFSLKKRAAPKSSVRDMVNISSYNSAFLTGLFADVAQASVLDEFGLKSDTQKRGSELISPDDNDTAQDNNTSSPSANKRSRLSISVPSGRKASRARRSYMNLSELSTEEGAFTRSSATTSSATPVSPRSITHAFEHQASISDAANASASSDDTASLGRHNSLEYQLGCVSSAASSLEKGDAATDGEPSSDSSSPKSTKTTVDAGKLLFPHLPATVSDSSCYTGLTRAKLDRQVSSIETDSTKVESFGWFVDLDGDDDAQAPVPSTDVQAYEAKDTNNLAFQALSAPVRVNDSAELEWAQAADTVDDVLGDLF